MQRGRHTVFDSFDLSVRPGEVTGVLGSSGCGKTTLLCTIVGAQTFALGTVRVLGIDSGSRALRTRVSYATQAASASDDLTVARILLGALLMPRDRMPGALQAVSDWLPLSYAVDAVNAVTACDDEWTLWKPLIIIVAVSIVALALAAATLRRRTP